MVPMIERNKLLRAATLLQELHDLLGVRGQTRYYWKHAAGEHQWTWQEVVKIYDFRIQLKEEQLAALLEMPGFKVKKVGGR